MKSNPPTRTLPMAWSTGRALSTAAASPPTMMVSVAFSAPTVPPDTGASSHETWRAVADAARAMVALGLMVDVSTTTHPGRAWGNSAAATASTSGVSVTHSTTTSFLATCSSVPLLHALAAANASALPAVRVLTMTANPALTKLRAM